MGLVARRNQLDGNANALAIAAHASLEHAVDMQLRSNFYNGFLRGLVLDGGSSRDHAQSLGVELSEMRDHLLRQPLHKVFLLAITTQILEGKDEEHFSWLPQRPSRA